MLTDEQTHTQTHRQTDRLIAILRSPSKNGQHNIITEYYVASYTTDACIVAVSAAVVMRSFGRTSVCLSVCMSVCPVRAVTFESLDLETLF